MVSLAEEVQASQEGNTIRFKNKTIFFKKINEFDLVEFLTHGSWVLLRGLIYP